MKRLISKKTLIIGGVAALLLVTVAYFLRFPPGPRPLCHRAIDTAFAEWMLKTGYTNNTPVYPNVNGNGSASLALIHPYFGDRIQEYGYVPGLRYGDPEDLVFMYLKRRTRYSWHGDFEHSILSPRRWMVLSYYVIDHGTCPEGGELLDTPEFKKRLQTTIAFLKEKQRPNWQAVAAEQSEFLKSIKE